MARRPALVAIVGLGVQLVVPGASAPATTAGALAPISAKPDRTYVTNGSVFAVARSGNTIYLGGAFTKVGPRTGPLVSIDPSTGQPQTGMPEVSGGSVEAITSDSAGGWYIGGDFTHVGSVARHGLAHILSTGVVDPAFDPSPNGPVLALLYFGNELYAGGSFTTVGGQLRSNLAELDASGQATDWNPAPNGEVRALAVHPSRSVTTPSTIYVGGDFIAIDNQARNYLAAVDVVGNLTSWDPSPDGHVYCLAVTGSGFTPVKVYAGGSFTTIGGQSRTDLAQLDGTGAATTWNAAANGTVETIAASGSTIYVGGAFSSVGGQARNHAGAVDASTASATAWNPNANGDVYSLAVSGNAVYAGGHFGSIGGLSRDYLAALDPSTGLATTWDPSPNNIVRAVAVDANGVLVGGSFSSLGGVKRRYLAALNAGTGTVTSWEPNPDGYVRAIAAAGSTVYVGGDFANVGGGARHELAALNAAGGGASAWNPDPDAYVDALVVSGSAVYAGGKFDSIGGQTRHGLAALDASTGAATAWRLDRPLYARAIVRSGTTVYVGGVGGLAAIETNGIADTWAPTIAGNGDIVDALAVSGSTVYIGGSFASVDGTPRDNLAAVETNGTLDAWNPDASDEVQALAASGGLVYAGGEFATVGGKTPDGLAAIDPTTGVATDWRPVADTAALTAYPDGTLYAGGVFPTMDLAPQSGFASFSRQPASVTPPAIAGTVLVGKQALCSKGAWSGSTPQTYRYTWLEDGTAIGGARSSTYTPKLGDAGHHLRCRVVARNVAGSALATSAPATVHACVVPAVKGMTLTAAKTAIVAAHCSVGTVGKAHSASVAAGRVISQTPAPKTVEPAGAKVNLVVSLGP